MQSKGKDKGAKEPDNPKEPTKDDPNQEAKS
jgi:hypothetical protein